MKNLLYKEFKLAINPFFLILPVLTGALMLIPSWLYFFTMLYFCFITIPNMFAACKSENDIGFSVMLPVRKSDVVKSRVIAVVILEIMHIVFGVIYAIINHNIYSIPNFFMDTNFAFFGLVFVMFAIFNLTFLPMFYKTGYKYGAASIVGAVVAFGFSAAVEVAVLLNPTVRMYLKGSDPSMLLFQKFVLVIGIVIFVLITIISFKRAAANFEKIDV